MSDFVLSPDEFASKLEEIQIDCVNGADDNEDTFHKLADELMCSLLRDLGYDEGVDIFESIDKSYAW